MSLELHIGRLQKEVAQFERVTHLTEGILNELMKSTPPPADLEKVRGFLRSASDLFKHAEHDAAQQLTGQAEEALEQVRQWLAVADLGISPFILRNYLEKNRLNGDLQAALIRYFLTKQPHTENDRDKLDYLLTAYFSAPGGDPATLAREKLRAAVGGFFAGMPRQELGAAAEVMVHELESLIVRIDDFTDFDQLVHARMVERARALKINLGEAFYHPGVLPTVVRFNVAFRRHFEKLFHAQLSAVRQAIRQQIEEAWALARAIETACEQLVLPKGARTGVAVADEEERSDQVAPPVGRPLEGLDERPPIDRLVRRGEDPQKEHELHGIIARISRFLEKLPGDQMKAEKVVFPLRDAGLQLAAWEREAFVPAASGTAPQSAHAIQYSLGVVAWLEEELARYKQTRDDRYLWKTHFDLLSYAVVRAVGLLKDIRGLIRERAPKSEAAWFGPLLQTALRLVTTLNHVAPVFADPSA